MFATFIVVMAFFWSAPGDRVIIRSSRIRNQVRLLALTKPKAMNVDHKTIVVVDEAGMVNTRHMRMIMRKVQEGGGTLILVGDPTQLPSIDSASPFRSICRRTGFAELREISRQKEEWAREAVRLFANGKPGQALRIYSDHRQITVREDRSEAMKALVLDWTAVGLTSPEQAAVLVSCNTDSETANLLCQEKRMQAGCLNTHQYLQIRDEDPSRGISYTNRVHVGDRVLFTQNSRRYRVQNGALGTAIAMNRGLFRKSLAVKLDNGERVVIPVDSFPHMRLGYAMTTHKAQGMTVPEAFVLVGGPMQNLPASYVQASRAIRNTRFYAEKAVIDEYLEDIEDSPLAKQMAKAPDLNLATDLLLDARSDTSPPLPASRQPSTSSTSAAKKKLRQDRRRRKSRKPANPDLTHVMAQVDRIRRRRKRRAVHSLATSEFEQLRPPKPIPEIDEPSRSSLAMQYLQGDFVGGGNEVVTSANPPVELLLGAHFVDAAVQAEVQRCDEEEERRREDERREQLRRQKEAAEAAAQERMAQAEAEASSFFAVLASALASSNYSTFDLSAGSSVVSSAFPSNVIEQQRAYDTAAAYADFSKRMSESTTTTIIYHS
ncbi:MAG: AAA family ATPase [Thermoguttaceae bacterium]